MSPANLNIFIIFSSSIYAEISMPAWINRKKLASDPDRSDSARKFFPRSPIYLLQMGFSFPVDFVDFSFLRVNCERERTRPAVTVRRREVVSRAGM